MRTSIDINDALLDEAKRLAIAQRSSLKAVVEDGLRALLLSHRQHQSTGGAWPICTSAVPVTGVDLTRTSELLDRTEAP